MKTTANQIVETINVRYPKLRTKASATVEEILELLGFSSEVWGGDTSIYEGNGKKVIVRSVPGAKQLLIDDEIVIAQWY